MESDTIRDLELKMHNISIELTSMGYELTNVKKEYVREIEKEFIETKSKELSNATKRNEAVDDKLSIDANYIALQTVVDELELKLKLIRIDRDFAKREYNREIYLNKEE